MTQRRMPSRPYSSRSLGDLERIFAENQGSPAVLKRLETELGFRKTKSARRLLSQVRRELGVPDTGKRASQRKARRAEQFPTAHSADERGEAVVDPPRASDLERRYEALRKSFTVESEILARWGMTEAMPEAMQALVFDQWCGVLSDAPDSIGRTTEQLRADRAKLELERSLAARLFQGNGER